MTSIHRVTPLDGDHFHGFYNIQPWNPVGTHLLCHRVPFIDRMPSPDDEAELGLVHVVTGVFNRLASTHAWNFQIGCMAHWLVGNQADCFVYNVREAGRYASRLFDTRTGESRLVGPPLYTVSHDGRTLLGYDFARVTSIRAGYAYVGVPYDLTGRAAPDDEGVLATDVNTGDTKLLLSYAELAERFPCEARQGEPVIISRLLFNADDSRAVLSFRFNARDTGRWWTTLITFNPDGSEPYQLVSWADDPAHFDWCGSDRILVWSGRKPDRGFYLREDRTGQAEPFARDAIHVDGHCCFSPDGTRIATDTFPDQDRMQTLSVYDPRTKQRHDLGRFAASPTLTGDLRCDLHPCWSRDGMRIAFDSLHEGRRAVYVADVPPM